MIGCTRHVFIPPILYFGCIACAVCVHTHTPLSRWGGVSRCLCACVVVWEEGYQSRFFQGSNSEYIARKIVARNKASWIHDLRPPERHPPAQINLSDTAIRTLTNLHTHTHTQTQPPQPTQPAPAPPRTHATTTCSNQWAASVSHPAACGRRK